MSMQRRPNNPIEVRKQQVRTYSRNAVVWTAGGVLGGLAAGLLLEGFALYLIIGLVVAVVGGGYNYMKVQQIVNHKDEY